MRTVHGPLSIRIDGARLLLILLDIFSPILMNCLCKKVDFPIKVICVWCITSGCLLKKYPLMFEKNVCFSDWHLAQGCQCIRKHQYFCGSACRFRGSGVEVSSTNRTTKAAPCLPLPTEHLWVGWSTRSAPYQGYMNSWPRVLDIFEADTWCYNSQSWLSKLAPGIGPPYFAEHQLGPPIL